MPPDVRTQWIEETIRGIHADWLLTPRTDLGGASPREVALTRHDHLSWDLQDRGEQWSFLGECPRGLDESSLAFRYGGFGTHELVEYYELVRALLWSSWDHLTSHAPQTLPSSSLGPRPADSFVAREVPRLETVRDQWFDSPDREFHNRTPRAIIHRERLRIPEAVSGLDVMVDPDCPCCQMLSEMPGPSLWHLDCSGMDDEFAFDIDCRTRDEWDERQREMDEISRHVEAEMDERKRLGLPGNTAKGDEHSTPWMASYRIDDMSDVPLGLRLFGLGCHLAELIVQLRGGADRSATPPEIGHLIDQLNRDFGNLRDILQQPGPELAAALFDPVIDCFGDTLSRVATTRADLAAKCESLSDSLSAILDA